MSNQDRVGHRVTVKPRLYVEKVAEDFGVLHDRLRSVVDQSVGVGAFLLLFLRPRVLVKFLFVKLSLITVLAFVILNEEIVKSVHFHSYLSLLLFSFFFLPGSLCSMTFVLFLLCAFFSFRAISALISSSSFLTDLRG